MPRHISGSSLLQVDAARFRRGDILLYGSLAFGFELLDAVTGDTLHVGVRSVSDAVEIARRTSDGDLWQVLTDGSGRQISAPIRIGTLAAPQAASQCPQ